MNMGTHLNQWGTSHISNPTWGDKMTKDETRKILSQDIDNIRAKANYYKSLHLFEAAKYANNLASNLELALTTMPSDDDPEID